ncbi:hypothetical protein TREMEDRAFT_63525 [Tremella mesenterica DSM 1558]|uniref:uncharacterized protein n=1 Tax=Tremella mesenterica (strain ATCC 24925 / CBS 8224 / DSM 1558 / NBRC 9311 / NRRL Y-6157 / RJB 2259-6 / UBC 559-6) TaxID=578456 RepID=UPI0003F49B2A|nr:uncharacterized protein TREMEDRAFT_63525 [Tremella mesenterica DSM 1558]EIW68355.1 hypothetical protein TREMEDRAFT_63525 [Tremella mesenterica DSM 1558]
MPHMQVVSIPWVAFWPSNTLRHAVHDFSQAEEEDGNQSDSGCPTTTTEQSYCDNNTEESEVSWSDMICDCVGSCQFESQARSGSTEALYKASYSKHFPSLIHFEFDNPLDLGALFDFTFIWRLLLHGDPLRLFYQSTQGDIRSDFDEMVCLKHSVREALLENTFGRCGERWTGNVLKYRMREGGQRLAAAIALLPNINPLPYSLRTLLECEIFSQSPYRLARGCQVGLDWPFKDEYEHTSPTEDSWKLASVWACWAQNYAKWLCGDENVWDSWEFENLAPCVVLDLFLTPVSNVSASSTR